MKVIVAVLLVVAVIVVLTDLTDVQARQPNKENKEIQSLRLKYEMLEARVTTLEGLLEDFMRSSKTCEN